ncbi:MAG: formylglycine-generating enzyme family protein [Gammaproteobacteria bacterium]|nr:formylglycine-generating enzyme family protein [Gammaproteobacteria bacterium]MDH3411516.1 formylglycine-generating enzyme family protein [Gammaproteobacteria bacterium]
MIAVVVIMVMGFIGVRYLGNNQGQVFQDQLKDGSGGPEMVVVPTGKYTMGSDQGQDSAKPPHEVEIGKPFAIVKHEVTFAEY